MQIKLKTENGHMQSFFRSCEVLFQRSFVYLILNRVLLLITGVTTNAPVPGAL